MKKMLLVAIFTFCLSGQAVVEIGEYVNNMCWTNHQSQTVCLDDFSGKVRVLIFNAGWCGPCNTHLSQLAPQTQVYDGKPVEFISLSTSGYQYQSPADSYFLNQWKQQHNIPFHVAAAGSGNLQSLFHPPYYIPSDVIIDPSGKLAFREVGPSVQTLFAEINRVLRDSAPVVPVPGPVEQ